MADASHNHMILETFWELLVMFTLILDYIRTKLCCIYVQDYTDRINSRINRFRKWLTLAISMDLVFLSHDSYWSNFPDHLELSPKSKHLRHSVQSFLTLFTSFSRRKQSFVPHLFTCLWLWPCKILLLYTFRKDPFLHGLSYEFIWGKHQRKHFRYLSCELGCSITQLCCLSE